MSERAFVIKPESMAAAPEESLRLLELPSPEDVPLIKEFGRLGVDRFMDRYAIQTQTDDRGFVDYGWLLSYTHSLVPTDHIWKGRLDVHHLQWTAGAYHPDLFNDNDDPSIPDRFREIPFHKLLIPRDLHDLIHITTLPPPVPTYEQMERRVDAYDIAMKLFQKAKQAIEVASKEERLIPAPHPAYQDRTYDPASRKLIERQALIDKYWEFHNSLKGQLSLITQRDVEDLIDIELARTRDPVNSVLSSLSKTVRANKNKQAIRPKVKRQPIGDQKVA